MTDWYFLKIQVALNLKRLFIKYLIQIYIKYFIKPYQLNYLRRYVKLKKQILLSYKKPNEEPDYMHVNSDHPRSILRQLPMPIEKQLLSASSLKEILERTVSYYEQYLSICRYKEKLNYHDPTPPNLITKKEMTKKHFIVYPTLQYNSQSKNW